jgi:hypothetical protein
MPLSLRRKNASVGVTEYIMEQAETVLVKNLTDPKPLMMNLYLLMVAKKTRIEQMEKLLGNVSILTLLFLLCSITFFYFVKGE